MKHISCIAILFVCTTGAAKAAEPMRELGMPLGKKMAMTMPLCAEQGMDAAGPCWVKLPKTLDDGATAGALKVPASVEGHNWAAPGVYQVAVASDGILRSVGVRLPRSDKFEQARDALSARFGEPARGPRQEGRITSATWNWKGAVIDLACVGDAGCVTNFALNT